MPEILEQGEGAPQEAPGRGGRERTDSLMPNSVPPSLPPSDAPDGRGTLGELDMTALRKSTLIGKIAEALFKLFTSHWFLRVLRRFRAPRVRNIVFVTRYKEVEEVL